MSRNKYLSINCSDRPAAFKGAPSTDEPLFRNRIPFAERSAPASQGDASDSIRAQSVEPRAPEEPLAAEAATPNSGKIEIAVTYLEQTSGPIPSETISQGGPQ